MPWVSLAKAITLRQPARPRIIGDGAVPRYFTRYANAWLAIWPKIITADVIKRIRIELRRGDVSRAMLVVPWYDPQNEVTRAVWDRAFDEIGQVTTELVEAAGQDQMKRLGLKLQFKVDAEPKAPAAEYLTLAKTSGFEVPINPYSKTWIQQHSAKLVVQISQQQEAEVRHMIFDNFQRGERVENIIKQLMDTVGLTARERRAVDNRRALFESTGMSRDLIDAKVSRYARKLHRGRAKRIAQTETIRAQSVGRRHCWQVARDGGAIPTESIRQWVARPGSDNPQRPCKICVELNGKTAPIDGVYESSFVGAVDGPPSHPHCACTETLVTHAVDQPIVGQPDVEQPSVGVHPRTEPEVTEPEVKRMPNRTEWVKSMSKDERHAFKYWAGDDYGMMRDISAGIATPEQLASPNWMRAKKNYDIMEQALRRAPDFHGEIYRGMSDVPLEFVEKLVSGKKFKMEAVSSFTETHKIAKEFARPKGRYAVIFHTEISEGGYSIADKTLTELVREHEILVRKDKEFYISAVTKKGRTYNVDLREIP